MLNIKAVSFYAQLVDKGRYMSMHRGYTSSGALDWCSYELGNAIVGNTEIARSLSNQCSPSSIEVCVGDFSAEFEQAAIVAICGATAQCYIDDKPCDMYRALFVPKGATLHIRDIGGVPRNQCNNILEQKRLVNRGMRVYISVRGEIDTPKLFASKANVLREASGGLYGNGKGLSTGDSLKLRHEALPTMHMRDAAALNSSLVALYQATKRHINSLCLPIISELGPSQISFIPGYQWSNFNPVQHAKLFTTKYQVTQHSDRMGMRLATLVDESVALRQDGNLEYDDDLEYDDEFQRDDARGENGKQESRESMIQRSAGLRCDIQALYSQGLCNGAMQVAGDGQIIIMLNDRQTIGGYPVLGAVDAFSRSKLAQLRPGDSLQFSPVDALEASAKLGIWAQGIKNLSNVVDQHLGS